MTKTVFDSAEFQEEFSKHKDFVQREFPNFVSFYQELAKSDYFEDSLSWLKSYVQAPGKDKFLNTFALFTMLIGSPKWSATNTVHYLYALDLYIGRVSDSRKKALWKKIKPEATSKSNSLIETIPEIALINELDLISLTYVEEKKFKNARDSKDADIYFVSKNGQEYFLDVYTPQSNDNWGDNTVWGETIENAKKNWSQQIKKKVISKYRAKFSKAHTSCDIPDKSAIIGICLSHFERSTSFLTLSLSNCLTSTIFEPKDWEDLPGLHSFFCYKLVPKSDQEIGITIVANEQYK